MTYVANGGIFTGNLWLDRYVSGARTGERDVGNTPMFTLGAPTIEQAEKVSKRIESFGQMAQTVVKKNTRKCKISFDDIAGDFKDNLVIAMFGTDAVVTVTAGAVASELITGYLGKGTKLAKKRVKSTPAITVAAETPDAWVLDTAYELGDFMEPTTPNGYRYECTTAGTSDDTTEPTWGTTVGGTTADGDGALVWTCRLLTYTVDVDYEVVETGAVTHIVPLATGSIEDGQTLDVGYSYDAYSGYKITADQATQIDVFARLVGKNIANDEDVEVVVYKISLKPTSDLNWIMEDFAVLELEGDVIATDEGTWDVEVLAAA